MLELYFHSLMCPVFHTEILIIQKSALPDDTQVTFIIGQNFFQEDSLPSGRKGGRQVRRKVGYSICALSHLPSSLFLPDCLVGYTRFMKIY